MKTVVLDPGHGGSQKAGGSKPNNATAHSSRRLEKDMTLELATLVRDKLTGVQGVEVVMTRTTDVNLSLAARARVAQQRDADLFLSIHFNGFNGIVRGVETIVWPRARNVNFQADFDWARRLQDAVFNAIRAHDRNTRNRPIKLRSFTVLNDRFLGNRNPQSASVACLLEVEFIDVRAVDELLNNPDTGPTVRDNIATAVAGAIRSELGV